MACDELIRLWKVDTWMLNFLGCWNKLGKQKQTYLYIYACVCVCVRVHVCGVQVHMGWMERGDSEDSSWL